jgi:excisionase family DNA binding protein
MIEIETPIVWPEFMTVPEAATVLRVSKMTVYRMIHRGDLTAIRAGRSFRIDCASMQRMITAEVSA